MYIKKTTTFTKVFHIKREMTEVLRCRLSPSELQEAPGGLTMFIEGFNPLLPISPNHEK